MHTSAERSPAARNTRSAAEPPQNKRTQATTPETPRRPLDAHLVQLARMMNSIRVVQRVETTDRGGLPAGLKAGVERLSGQSLDHVRVHRNSSKPAQLNAHAYAQGSDIHVGPGQEKHLPHEAWHVVQQAQGRVKPTAHMNGVAINDNAAMEQEADVMGGKAAAQRVSKGTPDAPGERPTSGGVAQRTPADWVASPQIAAVLALPHGWFSTWKKIKAEIRVYQALAANNFALRRASIGRLHALIQEWLANPKHPVASPDPRIHSIHVHLPTLEYLMREELAEMSAMDTEAAMGGHSLTRHGPDLTDAQLQNRITTGLDRSGAAAAADHSSRFRSYQEWVTTHTAAVNALDAAKGNTLALVNGPLGAFEAAWWAGLQMAPGAAKGAALAAANGLKPAINAAVAGIPAPSPNQLRASYHNVGAPGAAPTLPHVQGLVRNMVRNRARYLITIDHGHVVGPSFSGTGPAGGPHPGTVAGPNQRRTTTIFDTPAIGPLAGLAPAATWHMVTHFPSSEPVGIT